MKFIIRRASEWDDAVKPCEEAVFEKIMFTDVRKFSEKDTPKENNSWYTDTKYFNHRMTEDNKYARDFYEYCYVVELNSIEELISFQNKYGDLILEEAWPGECKYSQIRIYDDYIE